MNNKEINNKIAELIGFEKTYQLRCEFKVEYDNLTIENAIELLNNTGDDVRHLYTITSSSPNNYSSNIEEALCVVAKLSEKSNKTFVLSLEDGEWRAAFGDYLDCAEYRGGNPAYCTCMAILKFMGKI